MLFRSPKIKQKISTSCPKQILRIIGGYDYDTSTEQMCRDNDITTLARHIKILTTRFYAAAINSKITLIRALGTTPLPRSRQAKSPGYPKINQEAHWRYTYPPSKQNNPSCHTLRRVVKVCYRNHETPPSYLDWIGSTHSEATDSVSLRHSLSVSLSFSLSLSLSLASAWSPSVKR